MKSIKTRYSVSVFIGVQLIVITIYKFINENIPLVVVFDRMMASIRIAGYNEHGLII